MGAEPTGRPSVLPSEERRARASLVRRDMRLRSISATGPNAKQSILLFIVSSKRYRSFVVWIFTPFFRQVPMIVMISVRLLLRRDASEPIRVSPRFMREMVRPSFLLFAKVSLLLYYEFYFLSSYCQLGQVIVN